MADIVLVHLHQDRIQAAIRSGRPPVVALRSACMANRTRIRAGRRGMDCGRDQPSGIRTKRIRANEDDYLNGIRCCPISIQNGVKVILRFFQSVMQYDNAVFTCSWEKSMLSNNPCLSTKYLNLSSVAALHASSSISD